MYAQVLNISHNQISGKLRLKGFPALCALIANDNAITDLKGRIPECHPPSFVVQGQIQKCFMPTSSPYRQHSLASHFKVVPSQTALL